MISRISSTSRSPLSGLSRTGLSAPSKVAEIWQDDFTFMHREIPDGVFTLTMHPQVIGRGHRMRMLERLIGWFREHPGTRFSTLGAAADTFHADHPRATPA